MNGARLFPLALCLSGAGCEPPSIPADVARPVLDGTGVCTWVVGPTLPAEVLEGLAGDECVMVKAGPASRFTAPGIGCDDVDELGDLCAIYRRGEPAPTRWNDALVPGESLESVILGGDACRCAE